MTERIRHYGSGAFRIPVLSHCGRWTSGGGSEDSGKETARIKAEILSARSEKQCTTCEGDAKKLDVQIKQLETKLRQVQSATKVEPQKAADSSNATKAPGEIEATSDRLDALGQPSLEQDDDRNGSTAAARIRPPLGEPGHFLDVSV